MDNADRPIRIAYFTDILCIWAYVAQVRIDELVRNFPGQVELEYRFVSVFGDVPGMMQTRWADRGGVSGYADHVREVVSPFDHIDVNPQVWSSVAPASSMGPHAFVRAAGLACGRSGWGPRAEEFQERSPMGELAWRLRLAFFRDLQDVSQREVQFEVANSMDLPTDEIRTALDDGSAFAALSADYRIVLDRQIPGSPTYELNSGRQKLYGNVGYRILEANLQELIRRPDDVASWC